MGLIIIAHFLIVQIITHSFCQLFNETLIYLFFFFSEKICEKIYQTFFIFYSKYQFQQRQKPIQVLNQFVGEMGEMVLRGFKGLPWKLYSFKQGISQWLKI